MPDRDDHPYLGHAHLLLARHLKRTGSDFAEHADAMARLQVDMLRHLLTIADAAMDDEHIDRATADRILERVIYGAVPNPVEVAERKRFMETIAKWPARLILGPDLKPKADHD